MKFFEILKSLASNTPQILLALLVFGLIIFIHELGHFSTAKWSNIKVNEFSLGMGPLVWKRQKGETLYSLRLFPIGGFCAVEGEDNESGDSRSFGNAPLYKRMIFVMAGSFMNLVLGLVILAVLTTQQGIGTTTIGKFKDGAMTSQWLQIGDTVKKINNHRVRTDNDMIYELTRDRDGIMDIEVARPNSDGTVDNVLLKSVRFKMEPIDDSDVSMITIDFIVYGVKPTFFGTIQNAFNWTLSIVKQVWGSLIDLVTGRYGFNQLSGPVGVTKAIGDAATSGETNKIAWRSLFMLTSFITVNLGVFNMLPLPALDGGRMIFLLIEMVRRKPMNQRYEGLVHGIGFAALMGLIVIVTISDVSKLVL